MAGARVGAAVSRRSHPIHARAIERHAQWAREYAAVGDMESAAEALRDLHALASELEPSSQVVREA